jgi:MFS family permease
LVGAWFADSLGRKTLCAISLAGQIVSFYLLAGLTALYGESTEKSGIYGTISMIFLYNAAYAYGITPLTVLYPPEVLSYALRSSGMGLYTLTTKLSGLLVTMAFPYALDAIGWKTYIINASADIVMLVGVLWYWVETRGLTLEEVDKLFDGVKHSDVPDLKAVTDGEVEIGSEVLKNQVSIVSNQEEIVVTKR